MTAVEATLLRRAPAAIVVLDAGERVVYLNEAAERLFGWARKEATGRTASSLGIQPAADELPARFDDVIAGGGAWEGELTVRSRDGEPTRVHASAAPLYDARGNYVGLISVALPARPPRARSDVYGDRVGRRIALARREAGLTQQELADALGVTRRSLQGYEAGTVVPYKHLGTLGRILDRPPQWFLADDDSRPSQAGAHDDDLRQVVRDEISAALLEANLGSRQRER